MAAEIGPGTWAEHIGNDKIPATWRVRLVERIFNHPLPCADCGYKGIALILKDEDGYKCPTTWRPIFSDHEAVTRSIHECLTTPVPLPLEVLSDA